MPLSSSLSRVVPLALLVLSGCLRPSGGRPVPKDEQAEARRRSGEPGDLPPTDGGGEGDGEGDGDSRPPADWTFSLLVVKRLSDAEDSLYGRQIRPVLDRSCSAGGCHELSQFIDLRSYPFAAAGSYTMDKIVAELGADYDEHAAQKIIVAEIISSIETSYMPPPDGNVPLVTSEETASLKTWLAEDLPVIPANTTAALDLIGFDGEVEVCRWSHTLPAQEASKTFVVAAGDCVGLETLTYSVVVDGGSPTLGQWTLAEILANRAATIRLN